MKLSELKNKNPEPNFARKTMAISSSSKKPIRSRPSHKFYRSFLKCRDCNFKLWRQNWYGARILILGLGREGIDTFLFLRKLFPNKVLGLADGLEYQKLNIKNKNLIKIDRKVKLHFGKNYLKALENYDIVIKSPGIPIHLPEIEKVFKEGKITSQTEIFLENCPGTIVGITGTKGKSTTASLIYKILKEGGIKARLVGNIGKPVLNYLFSAKKNDVFVCEMSSHQLYNLKKSPQASVFLNVFREHLDYYKNFKEYARAKANIALHQKKGDYLIFNSKDKIVKEIAKKSKAKKISFNTTNYELKRIMNKIKLKRDDIPLVGEFNLQNVAAAIEVGKIFKVPSEKIKKAIKNFKPLSHRLEIVGEFKGIEFCNDSLSTVPEATIAAMESLRDKIGTLILGGFDRGQNFKKLAKKILESRVENLILLPGTGERILKEISTLERKQTKRIFFVSSMQDAVKVSFNATKKKKICLLSPASPSFGIFRDYRERGNFFKKWVRAYGSGK